MALMFDVTLNYFTWVSKNPRPQSTKLSLDVKIKIIQLNLYLLNIIPRTGNIPRTSNMVSFSAASGPTVTHGTWKYMLTLMLPLFFITLSRVQVTQK